MNRWINRTWDLGQAAYPLRVRYYEEQLQRGYAFGRFDERLIEATNLPVDGLGWELLGTAEGNTGGDYLFNALDALVLLGYDRVEGRLTVRVTAASSARNAAILTELQTRLPNKIVGPGKISVDFWYHAPQGPSYVTRTLEAPDWIDIKKNYNIAQALPELERLHNPAWRPGSGGQLLLWQGVPGTGKTYAIRSLVQAWAPWCRSIYITDPDEFFGRANYMMNVLLSSVGEPVANSASPIEKWKLVILEDCGELLTKDAKQTTGQSLARLLNITDGFVGQGLKVLLLLTTNEELGVLHDAVVRPGRCASKILFAPLAGFQVEDWLRQRSLDRIGSTPLTLAELYALADDRLRVEPRRPVGFTH